MKTAISAHHFDLTEKLHDYAEEKLQKSITPMVDDAATHLDITLTKHAIANQNAAMECRVHLAVPNKAPIVVHKTSSDMYAAIDLVHDTLLIQVRSATHRSHDLHHVRLDAQKHRAEVARSVLTAQD
jgi:ribosomal subunit interface protein